jgi:hypothetical protein
VLLWVAAQVHRGSDGGYWAVLGLLAAAGFVVALMRLLSWRAGNSLTMDPNALFGAFVPALIAAGWVMIASQPHGNWFRGHVRAWSADIHVGSVVSDLGVFAPVLAFGLGMMLGFVFDRVLPAGGAPVRDLMEREPMEREPTRERQPDEKPERTPVGHGSER